MVKGHVIPWGRKEKMGEHRDIEALKDRLEHFLDHSREASQREENQR